MKKESPKNGEINYYFKLNVCKLENRQSREEI